MTEFSHVADPGRVAALAESVRTRARRSVDLVEQCLARIREVDPAVEAWRLVAGNEALREAARRDAEAESGHIRGPLHGVPIGIKDIIDVEGLPTRCNSRSRADAPPATADAALVGRLRSAGAVVLGKLHTTEFAFFDPSPARNPHDLGHTPGGSSSGSAAAVAAGMVPMSVGTQTVASVNRPAAYCGIAAFKPSTGLLSTHGITPLGTMYDTPGFFGRTVADAATVFDAVCPPFMRPATFGHQERLRFVRLRDPLLGDAAGEIDAAVGALADRLANAGHELRDARSPVDFANLFRLQQTTMKHEAGRALAALRAHPQGEIGPKLLALIEEGQTIDEATYTSGRGAIAAARRHLFETFADTDLFLWPATPATAPAGLEWTGDPSYIAPWTALGGPILGVPAGVGAGGLPIGALLCGHPGADRELSDAAGRLAAVEHAGAGGE